MMLDAEQKLPAGDTAELSMLGTPHNPDKEHNSLSCSQMMERWHRYGAVWPGHAAGGRGGGGSAIIKAGNVASQTVSIHPATITCLFGISWTERGLTCVV